MIVYILVYILTVIAGLVFAKWIKSPEPFYYSLFPALGTVMALAVVFICVLYLIHTALKLDKLTESFEKWIDK